jgi:hypothetical protein
VTATAPAGPVADILAEARRLNAGALDGGIAVRLLGGAGIAMHAHEAIPTPLLRAYRDLDFVVSRASRAGWADMLQRFGYEPDVQFNTLHGHQRLLHFDRANGRQLDTFVGSFEMCHSLDLDHRIAGIGTSLSPADLLLTKLQVVEINRKDLTDILLLLADHPVGNGDPEEVDPHRLASVLGGDWGWYTTAAGNLDKLDALLRELALEGGLRDRLVRQVAALRSVADSAPRSLRWRVRSLVGRRMAWYDLPEEVSTTD